MSHLSFVTELGAKNKEGLIKKHAFSIRFCSSASASLNYFSSSRWLIIKDTWVAYLDPKTGELRTVLLVDKLFKVRNGLENTGERSGLIIENLSKTLFVKCYNEKRANEWRYAIQHMLNTTGKEFCSIEPLRFESFAPIRFNSAIKWFVDGAGYMESIADSIESATEEIFITGFFLSPEIYLKRPVLVGDKWRLDKLLKQKAEQGVKIYILIYKEIEITLPINSAYSKRTLSHKNIKVLRHPDHLNGPIMWAHHEKLVIIDQSIAYFGGIDLCYGRWDDHCHRLTDLGSVISSNSPKPQSIISTDPVSTISDESTIIPAVPVESFSSSTRSKISKESGSVRLLAYKQQKPHLASIFNNKNLFESKPIPDENNNKIWFETSESKTEILVKTPPENKAVIEENSIKMRLKKLKAIRMLSAPQTTPDNEQILSRNFLIDNMTDYYNNFIKKETVYCDDDQLNKRESKSSRFERLFNKVEQLKRSKSLELNNTIIEENSDGSKSPDGNELKNTNLSRSLKALHQRESENSLLNKFKRIKQFKESLKRYTANNNNNNSHDLDDYDENDDKSSKENNKFV